MISSVRILLAASSLSVLATGLLAPNCASASSLSIDPTRVSLTGQESRSITLRNRNPYPILVQARLMSWQQTAEGEDLLKDSEDLIVSPPIIRLEPDSMRVVRIAFDKEPPTAEEQTYRIIFSEVVQGRESELGGPGIQFAIQFSIPIFVLPDVAVEPRLQWALAGRDAETVTLSAENVGQAHIQIRSFTLECGATESGPAPAMVRRPAYVLPGARQTWNFSAAQIPCVQQQRAFDGSTTVAAAEPLQRPDERITVSLSEEISVSAEDAVTPTATLSVSAATDNGPLESEVLVALGGDIESRGLVPGH